MAQLAEASRCGGGGRAPRPTGREGWILQERQGAGSFSCVVLVVPTAHWTAGGSPCRGRFPQIGMQDARGWKSVLGARRGTPRHRFLDASWLLRRHHASRRIKHQIKSVDCQPLGVDGSALVHVQGAQVRARGGQWVELQVHPSSLGRQRGTPACRRWRYAERTVNTAWILQMK